MDPLTNDQARESMQAFLEYHANNISESNFDRAFYKSCTTRSAIVQDKAKNIPAQATFAFNIPATYTNQPKGSSKLTTHGGAIATFFDMTTSLAIMACNMEGWESTGVSRGLSVTYLRPPVEGEACLIEAEVIQIGRRLAVVRGVMKREADGVLLAVCDHQKYMANESHYVPGHKKGKL